MLCVTPLPDTRQLTRSLGSRDIEVAFHRVFLQAFNTRLQGGAEEPEYVPAGRPDLPHRILYRSDYAASALHEVAHWCVAGEARRQLPDFGYWYAPDGRSAKQQREFERVESRPQALEWIFSYAAGRRFRVSADNLAAGLGPTEAFRDAVHRQVREYCIRGLPSRAAGFVAALTDLSGIEQPLAIANYQRDSL